jgi:hypothetical protein
VWAGIWDTVSVIASAPPGLRQDEAVALVERDATAQIGQGKGFLPVAAVGCAD